VSIERAHVCLRSLSLAAVALVLGACAHPAPRAPAEPRFAAELADAISAHDPIRAAALFAEDADVSLVGGEAVRGRAAIRSALAALFVRYRDARLGIGRMWIGPTATVVELVVTAARAGHPVGLIGAAVVGFDRAGVATSARVYLDVVTVIGQVDPSRLPEGAVVRAPISGPPAGNAGTWRRPSASGRASTATTPRGCSRSPRMTMSTRTSPVRRRSTATGRSDSSRTSSASSPTS
jgi:hypothetical protein